MRRQLSRKTVAIAAVVMLLASAGIAYAAVSQFEVGGGTTFGVDGGPEIAVQPTTQIDSGNPVRSSTLVNISNVEFESSGDTVATVEQFGTSATWTNLSSLDVTSADLTVRVPNKQTITVGGDVDELDFTDMAVDDGVADFRYAGSSGTTDLTIQNLPASTTIAAIDDPNSTVLAANTTDGSGTLVLTDMPNSAHVADLRTTDGGPSLSDPSPQGELSTEPTQLSINVSDPDMPDDNMSVEFKLDGSVVGTDSDGQNGTASVSINPDTLDGGQHTVWANASDAFGATANQSWTFKTPDQLILLNESNTSQRIDNAQVDVRFFFDNGSQRTFTTRTTSNGIVNLTGLPTSQPLVASVEADGFSNRRIFIQSLFQQQKLYLLNESTATIATVKFKLRDFSGDFPQDTTVLIVKRPLNGSFRTVVGDYFGANNQFPAELAFNRQHTLRLLNTETGATRDLGTFTPLSSTEQTLTVATNGTIDVQAQSAEFSIDPTARRLPARNVTLDFRLLNKSSDVTDYNLDVYLINDTGNFSLVSVSQNSAGTITRTLNLTAENGSTLKVVTTWNTSQGIVGRQTSTYAIVADQQASVTLLGQLAALVGLLPASSQAPFQSMLAIAISIIGTATVAGKFRVSTELVGLVGIGFLTGFAIIGFTSYNLVFAALVGWISLAYLRRAI